MLRVASEQMACEDRLRRDLVGALTYPSLLACAGVLAVAFIFVEIVPRFSVLIGPNATHMPLMSKLVFAVGHVVNAHPILFGAGIAGLVVVGGFALSQPAVRERLYRFGRALPVVGDLMKAREIATWARLMSFALANGVALMEAAALARQGAPAGPFRDGLAASEVELEQGRRCTRRSGATATYRHGPQPAASQARSPARWRRCSASWPTPTTTV